MGEADAPRARASADRARSSTPGLVGLVYNRQRALLYPASSYRVTVAEAGLGVAVEDVGDGEKIIAWYRAPEPGNTIVLYFQGNGGSLWSRRERAHS